jgi:hypothetical protein
LSLISGMRSIRQRHGAPYHAQIREIIRLALLNRQMSWWHYFHVWPPEFDWRTGDRVDRFRGDGVSGDVNRAMRLGVPSYLFDVMHNKLMAERLMTAAGLPTTCTLAAYAPVSSAWGHRRLGDAAAIAAFLREPGNYPLFGKSLSEGRSYGAASLAAYDAGRDVVTLLDGGAVSPDALAAEVVEKNPVGYVFQRRVSQHPELAAICGDAVAALRLVYYREDDAIRLAYATLCLPSPRSATSYVDLDDTIAADVDPETGALRRLQQGSGLRAVLTDGADRAGRPLLGWRLPHWEATVAACLQGMELFREVQLIGWDVAIGPEGPVLLEGNWGPGHGMYQSGAGRGAMELPLFEAAERRRRALEPKLAAARRDEARAGRRSPWRRLRAIVARLTGRGGA